MPIDRTPDIAAGVTVFSAVAARFAEDPLQSLSAVIAIIVGILAGTSYVVRIVRDLRRK